MRFLVSATERSPKRGKKTKGSSTLDGPSAGPIPAADIIQVGHYDSDADDDSNSGNDSFDRERRGRRARTGSNHPLRAERSRLRRRRRFWNDGTAATRDDRSSDEHAHSSSSSNEDDADDVEALIRNRLGLGDSSVQRARGDEPQLATSDDEDVDVQLSRAVDNDRLEECIAQLQEILTGVEQPPSRQQLINYIIAADYDVNRAVNFIYN